MQLRKLLLTSAIVSFTMASGLAQAETVQDHYKNVIVQKPYTVQVCTQGNGKSDITNLLEGAIIGGLLNSENNKGQQCRTETRYDEEYQNVYSHSTVTFYHDGRQYTLRFNK